MGLTHFGSPVIPKTVIFSKEGSGKEKKKNPDPSEVDMVNHPPHYTSDPSGVECITITRHRNFNIGNAIKYLWRAGLKNITVNKGQQIEDLEKSIWYINDEIKRLKDLTD